MEVTINGERRSYSPPLTIAGLLELLGINPKAVVVERNRGILEQDALGSQFLAEGDVLEIVRLVGGG
jgi:thiamine biosynthesis protein ThiS